MELLAALSQAMICISFTSFLFRIPPETDQRGTEKTHIHFISCGIVLSYT